MSAMDEVFDAFLAPPALARTLVHLINNSCHFFSDSLTEVVTVVLKSPLSVVLNDKGVALFKSNYAISILYKQLNPRQVKAITELCEERMTTGNFFVNQQRVCGVAVHFPCEMPRSVAHSDVLSAVHKIVLRGHKLNNGISAQQIANIIIQRIRSLVYVDSKNILEFQRLIVDVKPPKHN
jgi:hypothetical protein